MRLITPYFLSASLSLAAPAIDHTRLLSAIAEVEQHQAHWLGGRYAMTRGAWEEITIWDYSRSRQPYYADRVARWRLERLAERLRSDGIVVTNYTLACCWHLGYSGFLHENQNGWVDYGLRVAALAGE